MNMKRFLYLKAVKLIKMLEKSDVTIYKIKSFVLIH